MAAKACSVIQPLEGLSVTHYLGALGLTGLTALYGLQTVRTGPEDAVVVSGAAGATGSMVVQIAKHVIGCRKVIGIAGNQEKCRWVESLGADVCLNYRKEGFQEDLKKATDASVEVVSNTQLLMIAWQGISLTTSSTSTMLEARSLI